MSRPINEWEEVVNIQFEKQLKFLRPFASAFKMGTPFENF